MRHPRRKSFAVPFIAVIAGPGCGAKAKPDPMDHAGYISRSLTACTYNEPMSCPKGAMCNPPPPRPIECPVAMGTADNARLVGTGEGTCALVVPPCYELSCATAVPCPSSDPLPPVAWAVNPAADGPGCTAAAAPRTTFSPTGAAVAIECPPALPARSGFIERATPTAECRVCEKAPCEPTAPAIACPPEGPAR